MHPSEQIQRQMDRIEEAYRNGEMSYGEYHEEMRLLQQDYRGAAAEAAQEEYDRWFQ